MTVTFLCTTQSEVEDLPFRRRFQTLAERKQRAQNCHPSPLGSLELPLFDPIQPGVPSAVGGDSRPADPKIGPQPTAKMTTKVPPRHSRQQLTVIALVLVPT